MRLRSASPSGWRSAQSISHSEMLAALLTAYGVTLASCVICAESRPSAVSRLLTVESRMSFSRARVIAT